MIKIVINQLQGMWSITWSLDDGVTWHSQAVDNRSKAMEIVNRIGTMKVVEHENHN